jgi:hypothetical protein
MTYLQTESAKTNDSREEVSFALALQYLAQKLGPKGIYEKEYDQYRGVKFLPCIRQNLETGEVVKERQSPSGKSSRRFCMKYFANHHCTFVNEHHT